MGGKQVGIGQGGDWIGAFGEWLVQLIRWASSGNPFVSEARSALLSFVVASSASYLLLSSRTRDFRSFWSFDYKKEGRIRIVVGKHSDQPHPRGYRYTTVAAGDAEAASLITSSLAVAYGAKYDVRCFPSDHFNDEFWREPVILVGGGTRNKQTLAFLSALSESHSIVFKIDDVDPEKERSVVDMRSGNLLYSSLPEGEPDPVGTHYDWAVITRGPNISTKHKRDSHLLLYGLHAFGTLGAAQMVSVQRLSEFRRAVRRAIVKQAKGLHKFLYVFGEPPFFQALVRVRVWRDDVTAEVADAAVLRPAKKAPLKD